MNQSGTIGIVGGGQLARMLTQAADKLGYKVIVLSSSPNSPAAQVGAKEIIGDLYDKEAINKLAEVSDYVTIEIEHLDASALAELSKLGKKVHPSPKTIALVQDKFRQKHTFQEAGIPLTEFKEIADETQAQQILAEFGGKILLKTRHGAYDGRGNKLISSEQELMKALQDFTGQRLYAEKFVPFKKELAVMFARDVNGKVATYPVVESIHQRNICVEVLAPAEVSRAVANEAHQVALNVANQLEGAGVFGIEMFLTDDDRILVNEVAPRVHNTGHYTIEACQTSQFEQHIRAITGMSLGPTDMIVPAAVMINVLGERDGPVELKGLEEAKQYPHTTIHLYGKSPTKVDRKMGHITVTGQSVTEIKEIAEKARAAISI